MSLQHGESLHQPASHCSTERRQKPRFALQCSIFLRAPGASDEWIRSKTANVSVVGAYFASQVELPPQESVEYVLTFPPELTHAPDPWRVCFYGSVVRVEPLTLAEGGYGVALRTTKHRYLSHEESQGFRRLDGADSFASVQH